MRFRDWRDVIDYVLGDVDAVELPAGLVAVLLAAEVNRR